MAAINPTRCALPGERSPRPRRPWSRFSSRVVALLFAATALLPQLHAQTEFQISSVSPTFIGAGVNGATLTLSGNLPTAATQAAGPVQFCFYTGFGSTAAITPSLPSSTNPTVESIIVPASTIQSIPTTNFIATNNYQVPASVYIVPSGTTCTASPSTTLSNTVTVPIAEPVFSSVSGPTNVPQTNSATNVQAAPYTVVLSGSNFTASTVVTFGTFGSATPTIILPNVLSIPVPAAFSSSPVGTTAAISICGADNFCSVTGPAVTLTVTALVPSVGALTVTPTPVATTGTTVLSAQFKRDPANTTLPAAGVPSGQVTFTAAGNNVATAPLTLDTKPAGSSPP